MEGVFPYADSDMLIYDPRWTNFDSEVLLNGEQPVVNLDSVMMKKSPTRTIDYALLDDEELNPWIQNNDTSIDHNNNNNVPSENDFGNCMGQIELWTKRAMKMHKERESVLEHSVRDHDLLQQEIKQRDEVIERLRKELKREKARRSQQVSRLKRELHETEKLVENYREELNSVNCRFEEYKARVHPYLIPSDHAWRYGGSMLNTNIGHGQN
ncbi:hypothetical protein VNO77_18055 [Canavalia gladiata]|uniref:Uncharacterized protein n=1 Tax=Canavalia gladiata TaxID=3824 RepID=A0AAN9LNH2_CANGL